MARFPKAEADIVALAQAMEAGLADNAAVYPAPPVAPADLTALISAYTTAKNAAIAAQAAAEQATADKDNVLEDLIDAMKDDINYAENTVDYDDDKLKLIGWAGRKAAAPLAPPGQARLLEAPRQGEGWVFLDWKKPAGGGRVSAYKVMRRERPAGPWEEAATAVITEATLVEQPRGKELEYRIIAVNKAGDGEPSNTAMVVL
jgi:hypothetical protein